MPDSSTCLAFCILANQKTSRRVAGGNCFFIRFKSYWTKDQPSIDEYANWIMYPGGISRDAMLRVSL